MSSCILDEWCPETFPLIDCRKMYLKQKDAKTVERFWAKLADHAKKIGGVFVHYEVESGSWLMKVDHF